MSRLTLPALLDELADAAPHVDVGAAALAEARRRRRRVGALATGLVMLLVATIASGLVGGDGSPGREQTAPATGAGEIGSLSLQEEASLPWTVTALPWHVVVPREVPKLSREPVDRARALLTPYDEDGAGTTVLVLGDDGQFRRLDTVTLTMNDDGHRNVLPPLTTTSLSPDGRWAALAQRDRLVLVDLTTGRAVNHRAPGRNADAVWSLDSRQVLVGGDRGAYLVDRVDRTVVPWSGIRARDVAFVAPRTVIEWAVGASGPGLLRTRLPDRRVASTRLGDEGQPWGAPAVNGYQVARMLLGSDDSGRLDIVDTRTGVALATLRFAAEPGQDGRWTGCCPVLGWDGEAVLFASHYGHAYRILRWEPVSRDLTRVTELANPAVVSLALPREDL